MLEELFKGISLLNKLSSGLCIINLLGKFGFLASHLYSQRTLSWPPPTFTHLSVGVWARKQETLLTLDSSPRSGRTQPSLSSTHSSNFACCLRQRRNSCRPEKSMQVQYSVKGSAQWRFICLEKRVRLQGALHKTMKTEMWLKKKRYRPQYTALLFEEDGNKCSYLTYNLEILRLRINK